MYVPETEIQEDIRVNARNVVSYLHEYEINTNMANVTLFKHSKNLDDLSQEVFYLKQESIETNKKLSEMNHTISRLTNVLQELVDDESGSIRKN